MLASRAEKGGDKEASQPAAKGTSHPTQAQGITPQPLLSVLAFRSAAGGERSAGGAPGTPADTGASPAPTAVARKGISTLGTLAIRASATRVARKCAACQETIDEPEPAARQVSRKCAACEKEDETVRRIPAPDAQPPEEDEAVRRSPAPGSAGREAQAGPGLPLGAEDDFHEREADRIASKVVARSADPGPAPPHDEAAAPPTMNAGTAAELTSGGSPLPGSLRTFFEGRFGHDLGHVRVHQGIDSARRNHDVQAHAFTYGSHVWLGRNQPLSPSFVMAHELVHVVQQTQPARVQRAACDECEQGVSETTEEEAPSVARAPLATPASPAVQRLHILAPYWEPGDYNGPKNHKEVLPAIGKENVIFTEAPVPNANKVSAQLGSNVSGEADFLDSYQGGSSAAVGKVLSAVGKGNKPAAAPPGVPRTVGVAYEKAGVPVELKSNADTKFKGQKFSHKTESAPQPGNPISGPDVVRVDLAPDVIRVADLKPSHGTPEAAEGPGQLDNYMKGFRIAESETKGLTDKSKGSPSGATWVIKTLEVMKELSIPDQFKEGLGTGQTSKKLVLKDGAAKIVPKKDVFGKIFVHKDPNHEGIFNYVWKPDDPKVGQGDLPATYSHLKKGIQEDIIVPATQLPKGKRIRGAGAARTAPRVGPIGTDRARRVRRKNEKAPVDTFNLEEWNKKVDERTKELAALKKTPDGEDAKFKDAAARAAMASHASGFKVDATAQQKENVETLKSIEFWTGTSAKTIGVFRKVFGKTFVKVLQFYERARDRLRDLFKSKSAPSGGGGLPGAVLKAAYKVIKAAARLLVQRTASELFQALQRGAAEFLKSLLPVDAVDALEEKVKEVEALKKDIEDKVKAEVDDLLKETIGPYEEIIQGFETAAQVASTIATVVNLVKWGARVVACLSPPAWGCLWVLAQPLIEELASVAVDTCWFQKAVAPALTGIEFVRNIPKRLANLILKAVRNALPESLHKLFPDIEISHDVNPDELECEDSSEQDAAGEGEMRTALTKLANSLGEERVKALVELLEAAGVDKSKRLTLSDVACLEGSIVLEGVTADQLRSYAKEYPVLPPGVPAGVQVCIRVAKQADKSGGGGGGGGSGDKAGGGGGDEKHKQGGGGGGKDQGDSGGGGGKDQGDSGGGGKGQKDGGGGKGQKQGGKPAGGKKPGAGEKGSGQAPPGTEPPEGQEGESGGGAGQKPGDKGPGQTGQDGKGQQGQGAKQQERTVDAGAAGTSTNIWPVLFEELGSSGHWQVLPDKSVDPGGTLSLLNPPNDKAILAVVGSALVNTSAGDRVEARIAPSPFLDGGYVLVSGPLFNRLTQALLRFLAANPNRGTSQDLELHFK